MTLELWHVVLAAAVIIFIGWAFNRGRPVETDSQRESREAKERAAKVVSNAVDLDLKHRVKMELKK